MKKFTITLSILFLFVSTLVLPCTTAIVSGKYTKDGRPLLFKHRDTGFLQNKIMYFTDGKYNYVGLINSVDKDGDEVWAGTNSTGFAIMNSASYNLNEPVGDIEMDKEGIVMKRALQECSTVDEFEELLKNWSKPIGVEANFGVIDAKGGAAYFETSNYGYKKIDVNDQKVAPFGYVIRSNYSFTGRRDDGYGYIRYMNAEELLYTAAAADDIDHKFLLQDISRNLKHSLTKTDLMVEGLEATGKNKFSFFEDFIPRNSSVATTVIQGVREDEPVELTTMWTVLGFQLCSVALPVWVAGGNDLPEVLVADETGVAPLCDKALKLKQKCFPITRGSGKRYINTTALYNKDNTGILQHLVPLENKLLKESEDKLAEWRKDGISRSELIEFNKYLSETILKEYSELFGL